MEDRWSLGTEGGGSCDFRYRESVGCGGSISRIGARRR